MVGLLCPVPEDLFFLIGMMLTVGGQLPAPNHNDRPASHLWNDPDLHHLSINPIVPMAAVELPVFALGCRRSTSTMAETDVGSTLTLPRPENTLDSRPQVLQPWRSGQGRVEFHANRTRHRKAVFPRLLNTDRTGSKGNPVQPIRDAMSTWISDRERGAAPRAARRR